MEDDSYQSVLSALNSEIPGILEFFQVISKTFGLKFVSNRFQYLIVSAQEQLILDFLGGCPAPPHDKWDLGLKVRQNSLLQFIECSEVEAYRNKLTIGGSVLDSDVIFTLGECITYESMPVWVIKLHSRLKTLVSSQSDSITLLFVNNHDHASLKRLKILLVHEWIHLIFFDNQIKFQEKFSNIENSWLYDEGLATWIEGRYATGKWDNSMVLRPRLEKLKYDGAPLAVWGYSAMALWFIDQFKAINEENWSLHLQNILQQDTIPKIPTA